MGRAPQQAFVLASIASLACVTAPERSQTSNNAPASPSSPPQPGVEEYRPSRPADCPSLPFGFHRSSNELEVVGSGLEGLTRERVLACMGQPRERSTDTWSYVDFSCTVLPPRSEPDDRWRVTITVRLYFEGDVVARVTHQRIIGEHGCMMLWAD